MGMGYNKSVALKLKLSKKQSVVALSVSTMWSKVFGFFREMLTAFYFGAGVVKDAFNVSQAIPGRIASAFFITMLRTTLHKLSQVRVKLVYCCTRYKHLFSTTPGKIILKNPGVSFC